MASLIVLQLMTLQVGHTVVHRDGHPDSNLDVYAILDAIGRVRLYFKPDDGPAKEIRICHFPDVVFDEPTTVEYQVLRPKLLLLRMQIDNLENTERAGYISRMEADLVRLLASPTPTERALLTCEAAFSLRSLPLGRCHHRRRRSLHQREQCGAVARME
jgi:hypothetical protein